MKKNFFLMLVAVIVIAACQSKTTTKPVDLTTVKENVNAFMDKYLNAFNENDANALTALLAEDGLFCGTDPSELLDKKAISEMFSQSFGDTTVTYHYSVDKREIRVAQDGNSALVMEQFTFIALSPKIPARLISHVVKIGDNWMIDFLSWAFIPKNEDISKLNNALE